MKLPILISYAYATTSPDVFDWYINHPNIEVLLDSGAFTAKSTGREISLDEYCTFLDKYKSRLKAYLALDVVGDPKGTDDNLRLMLKAGYQPTPVHVLGDGQKRMDELFELSPYVALAGLKRPGKGHSSKAYVKQKMEWANERPVHWLGYVVQKMIPQFSPYSVDSSSHSYGLRFGWAALYLGRGKWAPTIGYDTRYKYKGLDEAMIHLDRLGITKEIFIDRDQWRAKKTCVMGHGQSVPQVVTSDSWTRFAIDMFSRYGTRVYMAVTLLESYRLAFENAIAMNLNALESATFEGRP